MAGNTSAVCLSGYGYLALTDRYEIWQDGRTVSQACLFPFGDGDIFKGVVEDH